MSQRTTEQLLEMFSEPDDWLPEALNAARDELQRRGTDPDAMTADPAAAPISAASNERPMAITVICIINFIGAPLEMLASFSYEQHPVVSIPSWYPAFMCMSGALRLGCMIGLWRMSRMAFYTLIVYMCGILAILLIVAPGTFLFGFIPFGIQAAIGVIYFHKLK